MSTCKVSKPRMPPPSSASSCRCAPSVFPPKRFSRCPHVGSLVSAILISLLMMLRRSHAAAPLSEVVDAPVRLVELIEDADVYPGDEPADVAHGRAMENPLQGRAPEDERLDRLADVRGVEEPEEADDGEPGGRGLHRGPEQAPDVG